MSSYRDNILLSCLDSLLGGDQLVVSLLDNCGLHCSTISSGLIKLLTQSKNEKKRILLLILVILRSCFVSHYLNFSSILFMVVLVVMVHCPPLSVIVMTGVLAIAAFLSMNPTLSSFNTFS